MSTRKKRSPSSRVTPLLLTRQEAAEALNLGLRKVDRLLTDGRLRAVRIDKSVRFRPADLEAFIAEHLEAREG